MDMMWYRRRGLMVTPHIENVTGAIASFNSDYNKIPIKSLICDIEPIQEGSGDPSPENVRPISGRTGLSVVRRGKNLFDQSLLADTTAWKITHIDLPYGTYTMSSDIPGTGANASVYFRHRDGAQSAVNKVYINHPVTLTGTTFDVVTRIVDVTGSVTAYNYQIEIGSSITDYEPYKGSTYSVNWETESGTVYGGYVDVVSGKLIVDRGYNKLSDLTSWGTHSSLDRGIMRAIVPNVLRPEYNTATTAIMDCRKAVGYGSIQPTWTTSFAISNDGKIVIPMNMAITVEEFLSEYGNHQLCYPLATTAEIQLTPQEVKAILGVNNIWCDSGGVSVNYWKWGK